MLQYVSAILISHLLGKPPINILAKPLSVSVSLIIVVKKIKEIKNLWLRHRRCHTKCV